ncbi:MAG: Asp-tRNA(Asn)/Glu-tRNA(Gln) amidotransferase subunit GatC [Candidatus Sungbacteria bacterium]|uniref:Aspartyl/glutamyl-tRNA(Asn/Gln) amidotransferase subunit C n=1 Tax=Candidatus Sungiibacteriota bacterium TaxID=2750080 RepID=A0A9D6LN82_9BACT|nr:Asp-tRNA(Asn)/Glu-tRNA(Gln) amidotransferase subunit GatC [Candidatus Sungbacteria bacterium]
MSIGKEEIVHLADLARIRLSELEIEKFRAEIPAILAFIDQLQSAAADDVIPLTGGTEATNVFREDKLVPPFGSPAELRDSFINLSPEGSLVVPPIFEYGK